MQRAFKFAYPYRGGIALLLSITFVSALLAVAEPLLLKLLFDSLSGPDPLHGFMQACVLLLLLGVAKELCTGLETVVHWRTRIKIHFDLQEATIGRLHSLPMSFHGSKTVGGLMTLIDRGINGLMGAMTVIALTVIPSIFYLCLCVVAMVKLEWHLALLTLVFAPLPALLGRRASAGQVERERALSEHWRRIYTRMNEVLGGIQTVKAFGMEMRESEDFLGAVHVANQVVSGGVASDARNGALRNGVTLLARICCVMLGGWLVLKGETSIGTLAAFLGYIGGVFGPVSGLTSAYQTIRKATVSLEIISEILDADDPLADREDAVDLPRAAGDITFAGVAFSYGDRAVIESVDLTVRAGEMVALVGPSGSGKTTLMNLLQKLHAPTAGRIMIDGLDLSRIRQRSVRANIAVVLQDSLLFTGTVRDNLAYGRPDATLAEIEAAARAANAHEFICALPDGYNTEVGERGGRLSVGQRQRIAIGRALLKDAPILILDEATSALDAESESAVQEALARLTHGRTTFLIAHRLSTVVDADRILVLQDGRIIESGAHAELLRDEGYYASLVRRQVRGLRLEPAA